MPIAAASLVSPPLFTAADIRTVEQRGAERHPGRSLMAAAGEVAADFAAQIALDTGAPVLVLAGPGNNGGDALVAARHLAARGYRVVAVSRADPARLPPDAAAARAAWQDDGGTLLPDLPAGQAYSLVIDGLFGVGLTRAVEGPDAGWIAAVNALPCPRLALDLPSGLDGDTGCILGCAVRADHTLSFIGLKPGLLTADGPDVAGSVWLDPLGVEPDLLPAVAGSALTRLEPRHRLPPRRQNSHKGDFGRVGIVGAAPDLVGAGLLAGRAALLQGAGSVTLAALDDRLVVDSGEPRLMLAAPEQLVAQPLDALAIGPGLGQSPRAAALLDAALAAPCPLVLDADALNLLAADPGRMPRLAARTASTLMTPHPGEAARLLGSTPSAIQARRIDAARRLATLTGAHVALKGAGTVIAHPDGHYAVNTSGGPWLAQAGSGDRLTGMALALLAQGLPAGDALEAACWLHGSAQAASPLTSRPHPDSPI